MAIFNRPCELIHVSTFLDYKSYCTLCCLSTRFYHLLTNIHRATQPHDYFYALQCCRFRHLNIQIPHSFRFIILEDAIHQTNLLQSLVCLYNRPKKPSLLQIHFRLKTGQEIPLPLTNACKKAILALTREERPSGYNCVDFIMESVGLYKPQEINALDGHWIVYDFDENALTSGDIIALKRNTKFKHFAIYATHGIYLSKFGSGFYPVKATTLAEMLRLYRPDQIIKLTSIK